MRDFLIDILAVIILSCLIAIAPWYLELVSYDKAVVGLFGLIFLSKALSAVFRGRL